MHERDAHLGPVQSQEVDDVGPALPVLVAVAHQPHGDGVSVGVAAHPSKLSDEIIL
jgi:hypothetical protein